MQFITSTGSFDITGKDKQDAQRVLDAIASLDPHLDLLIAEVIIHRLLVAFLEMEAQRPGSGVKEVKEDQSD
jgi:hypothetical protein